MDISRHIEWFHPDSVFGQIIVIGLGATGSMIALELAKLGITNIHLIDDDIVEPHNLCNQILYGPDDIGEYKVHAAARRIAALTGYTPHATIGKVKKAFGKFNTPYVFVCVDSMSARKEIFEHCIWLAFPVKLMLDIRINAVAGQVLCFEPTNITHVKAYREQLYADDHVQPTMAGCRSPITVAATVHLATSLAMTLFINHAKNERSVNEILFNTTPWGLLTNQFI